MLAVANFVALAAPFADRGALEAAVGNCLVVDPTGVACCATADCGAAGTDEMNQWDVSIVADFRSLFASRTTFNADLSGWNTGSATAMSGMFYRASSFDQDIGGWDVRTVTF